MLNRGVGGGGAGLVHEKFLAVHVTNHRLLTVRGWGRNRARASHCQALIKPKLLYLAPCDLKPEMTVETRTVKDRVGGDDTRKQTFSLNWSF
jgi:hypothetical protein